MPRRPDPDLEERILKAADALWRRGGEKALTMRAVARAARTNTPAVYRRFRDRHDLIRGLLQRIAARIREHFEAGGSLQGMAEAYVEYALKLPHEYELFYTHARDLSARAERGKNVPIGKSRPNFAFLEQQLAATLGGKPDDHTHLALAIWATLHGTSTLLLSHAIPEGHEEEMRSACRTAINVLLERAQPFDGNR
jgi:AcrR family transcriptional regulator